jgi:hypothetical protein
MFSEGLGTGEINLGPNYDTNFNVFLKKISLLANVLLKNMCFLLCGYIQTILPICGSDIL